MLTLYYRSQRSVLLHHARLSIDLAREIDDESFLEDENELCQLMERIRGDRSILFLGRKSSGKSSVFASLIKDTVVAKYEMVEPSVLWRVDARLDGEPARYLDREDISGISFIDTADLASTAVQEQLHDLSLKADVVVCTLDAREVDDEIYWQSVMKVKESNPRTTCLIVVTHADLIGVSKMLSFKNKLRYHALKYLVQEEDCFLLSTNDAPAIDQLRKRVQEALDGEQGLYYDLRVLSELCRELLHKQSHVLRARQVARRSDRAFMRSIDKEIGRFQDRQREGVESLCDYYISDIYGLIDDLHDSAEERIGWSFFPTKMLSLLRLDFAVDEDFRAVVQAKLRENQIDSDEQFTQACLQHWTSVGERMKKTLHCDIGDFKMDELLSSLIKRRYRMVAPLYRLTQENKYRFKLRQIYIPLLNRIMPLYILICASIGMVGVMGMMGMLLFAFIFGVLAVLLWLLASFVQYLSVKSTRKKLESISRELVDEMKPVLREELEELILNRVASYRYLYKEVRQKLVRQEEMLYPLSERQSVLYRQFSLLYSRF